MARYPLVGGPCAGQLSGNYGIQPAIGTRLICNSGIYRFQSSRQFLYAGQQPGAPPPPPTPPPLTGPAGLATKQIGQAWFRLMHVYSVEAPAQIRKAQAARARIRRMAK